MKHWRVIICRSNPISPDPRVEKIANTLAEAGYHVSMLGWDRSAQLESEITSENISCYRLPIKAEFGTGMGNLPALLRWQWGLFNWLSKQHKNIDIIHACDFDTIIPALICKFLWGKKVIYDIFDFYADHLRSTPRLIKSIIRALDIKLIALCDAIILADDNRFQQIKGARYKNSAVINNTPLDIYQLTGQELTENQTHRLTIAYVGLLQVERGLLEMLEVLKNHPDWCLELAGFGGDQPEISQLANQMDNVFFHGRITYQEALALSQKADVLFATYDPKISNHKYASPNKVFEAMMLGKPIIVAQGTNMDRIVEKLNCGMIVQYGSILELEEALSTLAVDPNLRFHLGQNGRKAYESTFNWEIMQQRLLELYNYITVDK